MKTSVFIKQFKLNSKNEEDYLNSRITTQYVSYEEKIAKCENIVRATMMRDNKFHRDTPSQFMLFAMTLIASYTDIEIDKSKLLEEFNILDSHDLLNRLIRHIPEHEYKTWDMLIKMISDDFYENERTLTSFIENKSELIKVSLDTILDAIESQQAE